MGILRWVGGLVLVGGCYASHAAPHEDDAAVDALDVSMEPDAPPARPDAPSRCEELAVTNTETLAVDTLAPHVAAPAVAALASGDLAVLYTDAAASPRRVLFERRDPSLRLRTGPRELPVYASSIVQAGEGVVGSGGIGLVFLDRDGELLREAEGYGGEMLLATSQGFLASRFDTNVPPSWIAVHVDPMGAPRHEERVFPAPGGEYHVVARPDGAVLVGYPDLGLPYVDALLPSGDVEHLFVGTEIETESVWPLLLTDGTVVVLVDGAELSLQRLDDPTTRRVGAPIEERFIAGALGRRVFVARFAERELVVDVYDDAFALLTTLRHERPLGSLSAGYGVAYVADGMVIAAGLVDGDARVLWLARIGCLE